MLLPIYIDYPTFLTNFLPTYWQDDNLLFKKHGKTLKDDLTKDFSMFAIMFPFYNYLYYRQQRIVCTPTDDAGNHYGIANLMPTVKAIADGTFPTLPTPPWDTVIFTQQNYELSILLFVGNIVNLLPFKIAQPNIFTLNDPIRDILSGTTFTSSYPLGSGTSADFNLTDITNKEYANCLLARVIKFYGNPSFNSILNTVALVSQSNLTDISFEISGLNVIITIDNIPEDQFYLISYLLEFKDNYGEPLYMEPNYGEIEFILNSA
jgi:hypothetical protein